MKESLQPGLCYRSEITSKRRLFLLLEFSSLEQLDLKVKPLNSSPTLKMQMES